MEHHRKTPEMGKCQPFLVEKDWGVLDKLTGKDRTSNFLSFILDLLIKEDDSWKTKTKVPCICGDEHIIHPSVWLESLRSRQWVPVSGGKGEKPSAENLMEFFSQTGLVQLLKNENVREFVATLGVNVSVLMMANKTGEDRKKLDQAFSTLLTATSMNPEELTKLADVCSDSTLRSTILMAFDNKKLVQANQKVGRTVENAIRGLIRKILPEEEFKVEKVRVGKDAEILFGKDAEPPNDFIDDDGNEILLDVSAKSGKHLIEIKSARTNSVRMTVPQARQALNAEDFFTLCVVEITPEFPYLNDEQAADLVAKNCHFVFPIGEKLGPLVQQIDNFEKGEELLSTPDNQEMQVDVTETQIRIRVNDIAWQSALSLNQFIDLLINQREEFKKIETATSAE